MTILRRVEIATGDTQSADAFGRFRVSNPLTILEEKNVSVSPILGNKGENGGTVTRQLQRSSFLLDTGIAVDGKATRQTRQRANYQPGKSQQIDITFVGSTPTAGSHQRIGYFDDDNGLFFHVNGTSFEFVLRSDVTGTPVDNAISRASWDDPLDGTGPSGLTLDITKAQILFIDFQWLGVGRVRFGFIIDGVPVTAYENNWANIQDVVYMRVPNQPIRWQVENEGNTSSVTLEAICASVASEGGFSNRGLVLGFDNNGAGQLIAAGQYEEVLAVRLTSSGILVASAFPVAATVMCATAADFLWEIWLNAEGTSAGTWTTPAGSLLEYSTDRTGAYTGGVKVASGYVANQASLGIALADVFSLIGLGYDINKDLADVVSVRVYNFAGNETYYASLNIRQEA